MRDKDVSALPDRQARALAQAKRLEWLSIGYTACTVTVVYFVLGNSQAMKTAWVEDMLSTLPQISFLVALIFIARPRTARHPYGLHRSMAVGHLVAAVALVVVGAILAFESVGGLVKTEHPSIGTVELFGTTLWLGWLMMGVMALIAVPPVIFGRLKMRCAEPLHNSLLYADAAMSKADWQTNVASIVGVAGIGIGWWWMDAAAALVIACGILLDGVTNTRAAVMDLMDRSARTFDLKRPHPLIREVDDLLKGLDWVDEAHSRVRDMGHVFHVESFVVPASGAVDVHRLQEARQACEQLDWKIQDLVIVPVDRLPADLRETSSRTPHG